MAIIGSGLAWARPDTGLEMAAENAFSGLYGNIRFAANGSIVEWALDTGDKHEIQFVGNAKEPLYDLSIFRNNRDESTKMHWRSIDTVAPEIAKFIGMHEASGLTVIRTFSDPGEVGAIRQTIRLELPNEKSAENIRIVLALPANLAKHVPADRFIGDYLYGYERIYWENPATGDFVASQGDDIVSRKIALVARHLVVETEFVDGVNGNPAWIAMEMGVTQDLSALVKQRLESGSRVFTFEYSTSVKPLMSSDKDHVLPNKFLYAENWTPLKFLARGIEIILQYIESLVGNLAISVVVFALLMRLIFSPINFWSLRQHRLFSESQDLMRPKIQIANETLKGARKSERILEIYKEHGISPMSGLKGSAALLIQVPLLIAFFSVTTESAIFRDVGFLWITDLSLPDHAWQLPFAIPKFGEYLNVLPIVLVGVTVASGAIQKKSESASASTSNRGALVISLLILILFYSLAAALVLYWLVVNIAQIFESQYVKYKFANAH